MDIHDDLIREEACALALPGLAGRSVRLLEGAGSGSSSLLRARLLLVRNGPNDRDDAKVVLAELAQGEGQDAWRDKQ